jgi:hypothetical protein
MRLGAALAVAGWALYAARLALDLIHERNDMAKKGFKRERKLYHLNFETDELDGFECFATGCTLEQFVEISALGEELKTEEGRTKENIEKQFTTFARFLTSWNLLDDDDEPVACTYKGLASQEFDFVMAIMMAWMKAIATVSDPLVSASPSGGTSPGVSSLQLANVSQSLAS